MSASTRTWIAVAKKDFRDAVQSRALWALVVVFVVLSVVSTYAYVEAPELLGSPGGPSFAGLLLFTVGLTGLFVPLAAIVVCYRSIAGERELGSIKLLLSLPTTRGNVYTGKVVGRGLVLTFGVGVGLIVGLAVGAALLGELEVARIVTFLAITLAFAVVYATIVVGISATTGSTSRATSLAIGFFVVFELVWDVVPMGLLYVVEGFSLPANVPSWAMVLGQLSPSAAYFSSVVALLPGLTDDAAAEPAATGAGAEAAPAGAESQAVAPEIGLVILSLWLVVFFAIGYVRFTATDL